MRSPYLVLHPDAAGRAIDFRHPLEILESCHDHIAHHCYTLHVLSYYLRTSGHEQRARDKVTRILRSFDSDGRRHHDDEELDLFPRLLAVASGIERDDVTRLVTRLEAEHRQIELIWRDLHTRLERIARGESAGFSDVAVEKFEALHRNHMLIEEQQLMPLASSLLTPAELERIGESMARRRGSERTSTRTQRPRCEYPNMIRAGSV